MLRANCRQFMLINGVGFSQCLSWMGAATAAFNWPIMSLVTAMRVFTISTWFGWCLTSMLKGHTRTLLVAVWSHARSCSLLMPSSRVRGASSSYGPAMAYMSHGRADAESLLEFMDSWRWPTLEILTIFLGQLTLAKSRGGCQI